MELEDKFSFVQDTTDPSLMDLILIRLEEIQSEDDEFMQILLSKLDDMLVTWEQPWYQKSKCLTRPLKQIENNNLEQFRTDTICHQESKLIHKNWKKFRKAYGVPNKPICLARWRNKEKCRLPSTPEETVRRFVISFLAQGLKRNLYQVYKHVLAHYGSPVKGHYKEFEENVMAVCIYHSPKNTVPYLAAVLSRDPRGIYKRLCQICNGKYDKKKLKWTLPMATKFLKLLLEYSGEPFHNLKQRKFDKSIWLKLENDIGQQHIYLQQFWNDALHVQLFINSDVKINKLRRKVLKQIRKYPYKVWTDIRWKDVANHFSDGFSHRFLYRICRNVVYKYPGYLKSPLENVLDFGIQRTKTFRSKRLKTLVLNENQELELIKYDNKMDFK